MRFSFVLAILVIWAANTGSCAAQESEKPSNKVEKFVRIMSVKGNRMTVVESAGGRGRGRGRGMRGGGTQNNSSDNGAGRRRGRGRFGNRSASSTEGSTISVTDNVRLTYALQERRTNELRVGADINGRLRNEIFAKIPSQGLSARIVSDGTRLIEVNIIQENDTSTDDIAVLPKRPPRKRK